MSVSRTSIEHALDEIASDEGGMRFQGLAVVLAKLRWSEFVACERKKDLGLDAYASASLSPAHVGIRGTVLANGSRFLRPMVPTWRRKSPPAFLTRDCHVLHVFRRILAVHDGV